MEAELYGLGFEFFKICILFVQKFETKNLCEDNVEIYSCVKCQ